MNNGVLCSQCCLIVLSECENPVCACRFFCENCLLSQSQKVVRSLYCERSQRQCRECLFSSAWEAFSVHVSCSFCCRCCFLTLKKTHPLCVPLRSLIRLYYPLFFSFSFLMVWKVVQTCKYWLLPSGISDHLHCELAFRHEVPSKHQPFSPIRTYLHN